MNSHAADVQLFWSLSFLEDAGRQVTNKVERVQTIVIFLSVKVSRCAVRIEFEFEVEKTCVIAQY